jgi:peptidoglycan hydrolase-like protein with peptidoglycan-binding domain
MRYRTIRSGHLRRVMNGKLVSIPYDRSGMGLYRAVYNATGKRITVETEQRLNLGPPARMEIQQRLSALGLYSGPIDGDLGPGARSAIAEWQKRHDTAPTGQLGPLQLAQLRIESEGPYEQMMASRPPVAPVYAPVRVYHAYRTVEHSSATPAVLGLLGGLAVGISSAASSEAKAAVKSISERTSQSLGGRRLFSCERAMGPS